MAIVDGSLDGSDLQVTWAKKGHTGGTVPLYAFGPGAEKLSGFLENTDIPKIIASLLKIKDFPKLMKP
jgi:alkaline phosphatase